MRYLVRLFVLMVLVLAFTSCQTTSTDDFPSGENAGAVENIPLRDGTTLYFPRLPASNDQMEALLEGELVLEGGCLRALTSDYKASGFLILWSSTATARIGEDGTIEVHDSSENIIGRVGEPIRLGGGAMEDDNSMAFWEEQIDGLPIEGCPGPYWVAGALYPLADAESAIPPQALATPYSQQPAAGICAEFEDLSVSVSLRPDVPDPRCVRVRAEQYLSIKNETEQRLQVNIAGFHAELDPGQEITFETPFGEYLAPGVHQLNTSAPPGGPEIWLVSE